MLRSRWPVKSGEEKNFAKNISDASSSLIESSYVILYPSKKSLWSYESVLKYFLLNNVKICNFLVIFASIVFLVLG